MSHGYTTDKRGDDPLVALADEVMTEFSLGVQAGAWIVDLMPFRNLLLLKYVLRINDVTLSVKNLPDWMPGTGFKRIAAKWKGDLHKIVDLPHAFVKQQMVCKPSYLLPGHGLSFFLPVGCWILLPVIHLRFPRRWCEERRRRGFG